MTELDCHLSITCIQGINLRVLMGSYTVLFRIWSRTETLTALNAVAFLSTFRFDLFRRRNMDRILEV
jgi:hypothetical protein